MKIKMLLTGMMIFLIASMEVFSQPPGRDMSDKKEEDYLKLIKHLDIQMEQFLMIGNSLKSDILPVLKLGGYAVYIPFWTTWAHEEAHFDQIDHPRFAQMEKLSDILAVI